ncbi:hypothetical protein EDC01DRAFT_634283 [Geopyxis carbonaria]|nr:hypothetical protein EDC01DRAFT_634283 [Geopyxis carbonaria]
MPIPPRETTPTNLIAVHPATLRSHPTPSRPSWTPILSPTQNSNLSSLLPPPSLRMNDFLTKFCPCLPACCIPSATPTSPSNIPMNTFPTPQFRPANPCANCRELVTTDKPLCAECNYNIHLDNYVGPYAEQHRQRVSLQKKRLAMPRSEVVEASIQVVREGAGREQAQQGKKKDREREKRKNKERKEQRPIKSNHRHQPDAPCHPYCEGPRPSQIRREEELKPKKQQQQKHGLVQHQPEQKPVEIQRVLEKTKPGGFRDYLRDVFGMSPKQRKAKYAASKKKDKTARWEDAVF